jgi:hypothetical protein
MQNTWKMINGSAKRNATRKLAARRNYYAQSGRQPHWHSLISFVAIAPAASADDKRAG